MTRFSARVPGTRPAPAQPVPGDALMLFPLLARISDRNLFGLCAVVNARPSSDCLALAVRLEISQRAALALASQKGANTR